MDWRGITLMIILGREATPQFKPPLIRASVVPIADNPAVPAVL